MADKPKPISMVAFFESAPLYQVWRLPSSMDRGLKPPERLSLFCRVCNLRDKRIGLRRDAGLRTFKYVGQERPLEVRALPPKLSGVEYSSNRGTGLGGVDYKCSDCERVLHHYWVYAEFDELTIMKVGQFPEPDTSIRPEMRKLLGDDAAKLYKRGVIAEAHSFGIGAFAYLRRVVESVTLRLVDRVEEAMTEEERTAASERLAEIRRNHRAEERLKLAADVLPPHLREGGLNPLDILYKALSKGLHDSANPLGDEECLELVAHIRTSLAYLSVELAQRKDAKTDFTASMRALLQPKANPTAKAAESAASAKSKPATRSSVPDPSEDSGPDG